MTKKTKKLKKLKHYYKYVTNIFSDDWYIDGHTCGTVYYNFLDTTRPPQKPKELE
ncbi:hypothetical protein PSOL_07160 [Candidatus Phytoplasma solani]|uniref:hypothetical protein n=1 Tax=Candidatus Phytoplasma solani TaxID=69896 RepID=UPI0032D9D19F